MSVKKAKAGKRNSSRRKKKLLLWPWLLAAGVLLLLVGGYLLWDSLSSPETAWKANLHHGSKPLSVVWSYRPLTYECPAGVDVLSPTWLYVEEQEGKPVLHDLGQMGMDFDGAAYVNAAHQDGVRVWVTVVSFDPALSAQLVENEDAQGRFARELAQRILQLDADGVCFDFEKMDPADKDLFTQLVADAKEVLGNRTVAVAVTIPVQDDGTNWYQCYDRAGLAQVADYVALMSYDAHKEATQPVAPVPWVRAAVERTLLEVPSDRLLLGIPFYGVDFSVYAEGAPSSRVLTVYQLEKLLSGLPVTVGESTWQVASWTEKGVWQEEHGARLWHYVDTQGVEHRLWIEDADSLGKKTQLISEYSLAGCAVWRQSQGNDALWQGLKQGMLLCQSLWEKESD